MQTQIAEWTSWAAEDYYQFYFSEEVLPDEQAAIQWQVDFLRRAGRKFERAIEYGCGPTLLRAIAASAYVHRLDMADRLEGNLSAVADWVEWSHHAHDWSLFTEHALRCEGTAYPQFAEIDARESLARSVVGDLLLTDATHENPLGAKRRGAYDLIITGWCLECITDDKAVWRDAMRNVLSLLQPRGSLVMAALHRCHAYQVGDHWFPSCSLEADELESALLENGFDPASIRIQEEPMPLYREHGWESILLVSGTKRG